MAFSGVGTVLAKGDGASSEQFTAIAEVNNIDGPGMSAETIDTTSMDSTGGYREFISGFKDGGELTFNMNFSKAAYEDLLTDFEAGTLRNFKITLTDSPATVIEFAAIITAMPMAIPTDDKVTATITLKLSGGPTIT